MITQNLLYGGARHEPTGGRYRDIVNPATGEIIGKAACATAADVDAAVQSAKQAFNNPAWRGLTAGQRGDVILGMVQALLSHAPELIAMEATTSGGTLGRLSKFDVPALVQIALNYAQGLPDYPFIEYPPIRPLPEAHHVKIVKEPLGVCALITAWNVPLLLFVVKALPALAAGNTIVVKPADNTSFATFRLIEVMQAFLPPGVLNIVTGDGAEVGDALTGHPDVAKISFTGSGNVGRHIQQAAATFKRVTLELGGKGPSIVLADADLDLTARGVSFGYLLGSGQACISGTRLLVPEQIHDALVERLVAVAKTLKPGNPLDPATTLAPMASAVHMKRVLGYIEAGRDAGAKVACGGHQITVPGCEGGFFVEPTIFTNVTNDMKIAREEIFGPVICVIKYKDVEDAIRIANDTCYGLSAGVWSADPVQASAIATRLQAGTVWVNEWHSITVDAPFGGYKESGYGKEISIGAIENFLQAKSIVTSFERKPEFKVMQSIVLG